MNFRPVQLTTDRVSSPTMSVGMFFARREDDLYQFVFSLSLTDIVSDGNMSVYKDKCLGDFGM